MTIGHASMRPRDTYRPPNQRFAEHVGQEGSATRNPPLSLTPTGSSWVAQFDPEHRSTAAALLDGMLLLHDGEVAGALLSLLEEVVERTAGTRRRIALYAEREIAGRMIFKVKDVPDRSGRVRRRAVGRVGAPAVEPVRGSTRVGSEGMVAFVISQAVKSKPRTFLNHPGPDRFRGKRPVGTIVIVADFIGSGTRVLKMLGKFWAVPTIRAWASRGWIEFLVVAAAGTRMGVEKVRADPLIVDVLVRHVAPTVHEGVRSGWRGLAEKYGPEVSGEIGRFGFEGCGALIAFTYGMPNNVPLILQTSAGGWHALFEGHVPSNARSAFGVRTGEERIAQAAEDAGVELRDRLSEDEATMVIVLGSLRGRWRPGAATAMAEMTGLDEPAIIGAIGRAVQQGLLDPAGRLTDAGHLTMGAARPERRRPTIPTNDEPYYRLQLRAPASSSRNSRPSGRPR